MKMKHQTSQRIPRNIPSEVMVTETRRQYLRYRIGLKFKRFRQSKGVSQAVLAEVLGVHQPAICRIEQGKQSLTVEELAAAADFLGYQLEDFLG